VLGDALDSGSREILYSPFASAIEEGS
jgi:hypothetical protein